MTKNNKFCGSKPYYPPSASSKAAYYYFVGMVREWGEEGYKVVWHVSISFLDLDSGGHFFQVKAAAATCDMFTTYMYYLILQFYKRAKEK